MVWDDGWVGLLGFFETVAGGWLGRWYYKVPIYKVYFVMLCCAVLCVDDSKPEGSERVG
jgi:hypothetical protein